jgi:hypothetical protein
MDSATTSEIAATIASQQVLAQWQYLAITVAVAIVVGAASAFGSAYLRRRAENLATKADFQRLLQQLQQTTSITEQVKATVLHADWLQREQKSLRRQKLEELMSTIYSTQDWLDIYSKSHVFDSGRDPGTMPMQKAEMIATLYFPELERDVVRYSISARRQAIHVLQAKQAIQSAPSDAEGKVAAIQKFAEEAPTLYQDSINLIPQIEKQARAIMAKLIGA